MIKQIIVLFYILISIYSNANEPVYSKAKIWFDGKSEIKLASLGIDLTEGEFRKSVWFVSDFSENEIKKIHEAGFRTDILIADVSSYYRNRNTDKNKLASAVNSCGPFSPDYTVPSNFYLGSMGGFFGYNQLQDILDSMALLYPALITVKQPIDSPYSIEGNPIYYLKISDNPNVDENEPEVMYSALHHAREPESLSQLIFYMWYLLENYNTNLTVKALVDNTEMFFIPCVNPDGYIFNESNDPQGGGMWRKNRRDNLDGEFGVDLNRNYGFNWGYDSIGSSPETIAGNYRGTSAFSEPETEAMKKFSESHNFRLALNYHTYGNLHIYPWGYIPDFQTPDSIAFNLYAEAITKYNNYLVGTANQTVNYIVNGNSDDWMYGEQLSKPKIFAMTPEVGRGDDGFWPDQSRIIPLSQDNVYANLTLAKLAGHYGVLTQNESKFVTQLNYKFGFTFTQLGLDTSGNFTIAIQPVSLNIASTGSAVVFSNLNSLQEVSDSISINLSPAIIQGDEIRFLITVDNGMYLESDTITQIFGSPVIVLYDDGVSLSFWNAGSTAWATTTEDFVTPPTSISDSPFNTYQSNAFNELTLATPVSLSGALFAQLSFYAKWEIENDFDYVQVLVSPDQGQSWTALCGEHTVAGTFAQQPGEPVYDDVQQSWVKEEMSLNDFLGQDILIKFSLISDSFQELDGFYFDDLTVEIIQDNVGIAENKNSTIFISSVLPNPASNQAYVGFTNADIGSTFFILNSLGQQVWKQKLNESFGKIIIPVNIFSNGIYTCFIQSSDNSFSKAIKMVVNN